MFVLILAATLGHVEAAGTAWQANGLPLCTEANDQSTPDAIDDGAKGAFVVWRDERTAVGVGDIYLAHVTKDGDLTTPVNGLGICTATGNQLSPTIAPDGAGGCIVAWSDQRSGTSRIFAQRINVGNVPLWTAGGLQISPNTGKQQSPAIVEDGENGAIISWADDSTGVFLVHATRVDGDGAVVWSRKVNPTALGQGGATLARDRESGTFICWEQAEPNFGNVYAMWLRHDDGFSDGPIAVSAEPNIVALPALVWVKAARPAA